MDTEELNDEQSLYRRLNPGISFNEETPNLSFTSKQVLNDCVVKKEITSSPFDSQMIDMEKAGLLVEISPNKAAEAPESTNHDGKFSQVAGTILPLAETGVLSEIDDKWRIKKKINHADHFTPQIAITPPTFFEPVNELPE